MTVQDNSAADLLGGEAGRVADAFAASTARRASFDAPYRHYLLESVFPADVVDALATLPFAAPDLGGVSGRRELHNDSRSYFDAAAMARFPVMRAIAEALQSPRVVKLIAETFAAPIDDTFLRLEYAQDVDGFWLEPHTDIGAKLFTMLVYLSTEPGSEAWGTDILDADFNLVATAPHRRNGGLIFIPASDTWHGFHKRPINGVRRSLIVNYVKPEWRSRHELAYPDRTVGA